PLALEPPVSESLHALFGYTREDLKLVIAPMARDGKEAVWSMGDDTPVSALARVPRSTYSYFRQRFAQVTNPPIDPLREDLMMSLRTLLGRRPSCSTDSEHASTLLTFASPVLSCESPQKLLDAFSNGLKKVMSKLGISDVASYRGGQFFQTIGFDSRVAETCFSGTTNLLGKIGFGSIQQQLVLRTQLSPAPETELNILQDYGSVRYRKADNADQHGCAPPAVRAMQAAVG